MVTHEVITAVLLEEDACLTFAQVCQQLSIPEGMLRQLMEHGLFEATPSRIKSTRFNANELARVQAAARLKQDLGVNIPGVVLVIELIDELEQLRQKIQILQRHLDL